MEIVDGYQLLEQPLLVVVYLQPAHRQLEQQLHNAKPGDRHAYQMELLVYQSQLVHHIQHKLLVETLVQTVLVSGSLQQEQQQQELADYNYAQMPLQTSLLMQDALHFQRQLLVQLLEPLAFHKLLAQHTQFKPDAFKEQMEFANGLQQQLLQQIQLLLQLHQFVGLRHAQIPY